MNSSQRQQGGITLVLQQGSLWSDTENFPSNGQPGHGLLMWGQPKRSKPQGKPNLRVQSNLWEAALKARPLTSAYLPAAWLLACCSHTEGRSHTHNPHATPGQGTQALPEPCLGLTTQCCQTTFLLPLFNCWPSRPSSLTQLSSGKSSLTSQLG